MKIFNTGTEFIFIEDKTPFKCINILIAEGKLINLFPLYLVHKIFNILFGGGTFNEDIYMFKEDNFKVILVKKSMYCFDYNDQNKHSIGEYELIFTGNLNVMLKAIKKFSKKREPRLSLLSYNDLFKEIIEKLEGVIKN